MNFISNLTCTGKTDSCKCNTPFSYMLCLLCKKAYRELTVGHITYVGLPSGVIVVTFFGGGLIIQYMYSLFYNNHIQLTVHHIKPAKIRRSSVTWLAWVINTFQ